MAERSSRHRTIAVDVGEEARSKRPQVTIAWFVLAPLGALAVVAAGWLLMAGPAALGWLTSPSSQLPDALALASRVLLLANWSSAHIGGQRVRIAPLGLALAVMLLGVPVSGLAARHAARAGLGDAAASQDDLRRLVLRVGGTYAATYALAITLIALVIPGSSVLQALLGGCLIGLVPGLWGAARSVGYDPGLAWPGWIRVIPRALWVAVLTCVGTGAVLLTIALILSRDRVASIADGLGGDAAAGVLLVVLQLAWLPNLVIWSMAWALGAGITLGEGTLLNMNGTSVGFLPSIPVLGAVPEPGPLPGLVWLWLLGGITAGALVGLIITLARPARRFGESALAGGLSGVASGVLLVVAAWLSSGGLGLRRLAYLGVRLQDLMITAPGILGLSGLVTGLMVGVFRREWSSWRRPGDGEEAGEQSAASGQSRGEDDEETRRR